jgi:hypothetical protein
VKRITPPNGAAQTPDGKSSKLLPVRKRETARRLISPANNRPPSVDGFFHAFREPEGIFISSFFSSKIRGFCLRMAPTGPFIAYDPFPPKVL